MIAPVVEPRYFGPHGRALAGWLHHAARTPRDLGLLICNPFGYETVSAGRSLRHFADAVAREGIGTLRFDYHGTGDSSGDERDPARWAAWIESVQLAAEELKSAAGVSRICLLGVRLGATLATLAAAARADVAGLAMVAPVVAGKAWLREMRALDRAMGLAGPPPGFELAADEQEAVGYILTAETRADIGAADLARLETRPATDVLLLDRDDLPPSTALAGRLTELGASLDHRRLPGYAAMMLDPHDALVPDEMVAALTAWLVQRAPAAAPRDATPVDRVTALVTSGVAETIGFLDQARTLVGIISAPAGAPRPARAIVLLNAGAISHVGGGRFYVDLARRWAARGYLVLRFDIAGIGESRPWPGALENVVYPLTAVADTGLALAHLRDVWGARDVQALGLCSGAYHGFKAAVAGQPLRTVAVINPLVFFWRPGMSLAYPDYRVSQAVASYKVSIWQLKKWKKLVRGKVDLRSIFRIMTRRLAQQAATLTRDAARAAGRQVYDDLGAELETVDRLGIALRFVFATGDPGEDLLRTQAGRALRRLLRSGRIRIRRIEGPNHSFTAAWSRAVLTQVLEEELEVR